MATPIFISQNAADNTLLHVVRDAFNSAEEAYGESQNTIYNEGDAAQCETAEELNQLLRDHAQRIAASYENVLRSADADDKKTPDWKKAWSDFDTFENKVKDALESEVDDQLLADLNFYA